MICWGATAYHEAWPVCNSSSSWSLMLSLCSWWLQLWNQKMLAPWKKIYDNPRQHIKIRDITLTTKVYLVKPMVFPVVMYGCESYTIKKAECQRIDSFELWCWRRLWRVPWTARSNQSVLKEISPEYSLKGLILSWSSNTLATWCEASTHWKIPYCWKRLRAGGEGGVRGWDGWMVSPTQWAWVWANSGRQWRTGKPSMLQSMRLQSLIQLSN